MGRKWKDLVEDVGYSQDVIAKIVPKGDVRGLLKKDVIIDPGEVVVLIKDGKIEDVLTQTKLKDFGGGFGGWLQRAKGKGEDEILLFMVTTPIDLEMPVSATSKDYVETKGKCTVKVQLREENATKIFNLLQKEQFLTKIGLEDRILPEIDASVFQTMIPKYDAEEFRGNTDLIKEMETAVEVELRKTFDLYGVNLLKVFTALEPDAYDELIYDRKIAAAELEKKRADAELEAEMEDRETNRAMDMFQQVQEAKRERMGMEQDFKMKQMETQTGATERVMSEALKDGTADSDALQEMMRQMTMQKMADRETEKVKAVSEAEKARFDLDAHKEAEDREREHAVKRMDEDAKIMDAAKQKLPETLVQGPNNPSVTVETAGRREPQTICPDCGGEVLPGWTVCPGCGASLVEEKNV